MFGDIFGNHNWKVGRTVELVIETKDAAQGNPPKQRAIQPEIVSRDELEKTWMRTHM